MASPFSPLRYKFDRQVLAYQGFFSFFNESDELVLYCQGKLFTGMEDLHLYSEKEKKNEVLTLKPVKPGKDYLAIFDVVVPGQDGLLGTIQYQKGKGLDQEVWEILNSSGTRVAALIEDSQARAMARRMMFGDFLPKKYYLVMEGGRIGLFSQKFNLTRLVMELDFTADILQRLDRRLGIASAVAVGAFLGFRK